MDAIELTTAFEGLESEDPVAFDVYRRRRLTPGKVPTLQELGDELGVSRERVRQLESRFAGRLSDQLEHPESAIALAAAELGVRLGPFATAGELDRALNGVDPGRSVLSAEHRLLILLKAAGPYEVKGRWCLRRGTAEAADDLIARAMAERPLPIARAVELLGSVGMAPLDAEAWLGERETHFEIEGHLVGRGRSQADRGVAVLAVKGDPMTLEEIFDALDEKRSFRGFKSQMQSDARVMRRGLKHYGLREWGGEEYTTVTDEMCQEIERHGGDADLEELSKFLGERFGISPSSVRMYATGAHFSVDDAGRIRVAERIEMPETRSLSMTRGCFRLARGWALRRAVDADVLRGSGGGIPLAFAKELGLAPGATLALDTPYGKLNCSWPSHVAHVGSMRKIAEHNRAEAGDYLFLIALEEGRADVLHVAAADCKDLQGVAQAAKRCGCSGDQIEDVAAALGIDVGLVDLPAVSVRQQFLSRREEELAALIDDEGDDLLTALEAL